MKKSLLKIGVLSAVFAIGATLSFNTINEPTAVFATQHEQNYADYTYSGSYYSTIADSLTDGLNGTLRKALSSLILPKGWYTYSGSQSGQLGKELQNADEDPTNSSNMVLLYSRDSITKRSAGGSTTDWNREHVWPRANSNNNWSSSNGGSSHAGTDILHVRPTWSTTNSARGSTKYGDNNKAGAQTYNGMTYAYTSGSYFEPIDSVKGDVARILMYVWTAYIDFYNDSGLVVTKAIQSYDILLKWHTMDKPDALEGHRNDFAETSKQKNRNPFVDHPEYAWKIFGSSVSNTTILNECKETYPDPNTPVVPPVGNSSAEPISSSEIISSSEEISSSSEIISSSEETSSSEPIISSEPVVSSEPAVSYEPEISSSEPAPSYSCIDTNSSISSEPYVVPSSSNINSTDPLSSSETTTSLEQQSQEESVPPAVTSEEEIPSNIESEPVNNSSNNDKKSTAGCTGSAFGITFISLASALVGIVFIASKKK